MKCIRPLLGTLNRFAFASLKYILLVVVVSAFAGTLHAQDDNCQATCRSSDSPCTGLIGSRFTQCVKQCVQSCPSTHKPPPPPFDPGCNNRSIQGKIRCTIFQPPVTQHETPIPEVLFAPGDIVDVTADGCVQTGGHGDTWKRYVNPSGPNSGQYYHGLVRIPTGTPNSALVRVNTVIARHLLVTGQGVPVDQLMLHLGYEDDGFSDNGYYAHDDGTEDQCKTSGSNYGGPAFVTVIIYRGVSPDDVNSRFDFDVVSKDFDPNGLPYNPQWTWQVRNPGQIPDTGMCHNFSRRGSTLGIPDEFMSPYFGDCTDQTDLASVDLPIGINATICNYGTIPYFGDTFAGHVNWFPVTMEGHGGWGDHGADDDYTFTYETGGDANPLSVNGRSGLHIEFDSDETIDNFHSAEWEQLHQAVDAWKTAKGELVDCNAGIVHCTSDQITALQQTVDAMPKFFNGHTILTGMFGLDGEHGLKAELHPVYAFSTLRDNLENDPGDEVWLMFIRNQGDEGYCSSSEWDSGLEDYTVKLPWRENMSSVDVNWEKTQFEGTDGTSGPTVRVLRPPSKDAGVYVTFHLGPPVQSSYIFDPGASVPFLDGALHLMWSGNVVTGLGGHTGVLTGRLPATAIFMPRAATTSPQGQHVVGVDDAEDMLRSAIQKVPAAQRPQVEKARVVPNAKTAVVHALPKAGKVESIAQPPRLAVARIAKPHAIKGGAAVRKAARDDAQVKALCAATNNAPADLPASVCHPQVRIPATTGGEVRDHRTTGGTVRDHRTPSTGPTPAQDDN